MRILSGRGENEIKLELSNGDIYILTEFSKGELTITAGNNRALEAEYRQNLPYKPHEIALKETRTGSEEG